MAGDSKFLFEILMEGAEAVKSALEGLGTAGAEAFNKLADAANKEIGTEAAKGLNEASTAAAGLAASAQQVNPPMADLANTMAGVEASAHRFGTALADLGSSMASVAERSAVMVTAVSGIAIGLAELVRRSAESVLAVTRMATVVGTTADSLEKLRFGAEQTGFDADKLSRVMTVLSVKIDEFATATNSANTKLGQLGISLTRSTVDGFDTAEVFKQIADKFAGMEDGAKKTALAAELFGKKLGPLLIPFLNQGSAGIEKMNAEAERLGLTFSKMEQKIALDTSVAFGKFNAVISATTNHFALLFGPAVSSAINALTELIVANKQAFLDWGKVVADIANQVGKDVLNALKGNDDQVEFKWVITLRDTITGVATIIQSVLLPAFAAIRGAAQLVADGINAVFGTKLTGDALLIVAAGLKMIGMFGLLASAISVVTTAVGLLVTAIKAFGGIAALANPVVLIIIALGVAVLLVVTYWDEIKAAANAAFAAIGQGIEIAKQLFNDWVATPVANAWTWVVDTFNAAVELLKIGIELVKQLFLSWVVTPIEGAWAWIKDTFNAAVDLLKAALEIAKQAVIDWVINPVSGAWEWLSNLFNSVVEKVKAKALELWNELKRLFVDENPAAGAVEAAASGGGGGEAGNVASATTTPKLAAAIASSMNSIAQSIGAATSRGPNFANFTDDTNLVKVDLTTDGGTFRVAAQENVVQALTTYASRRKRASLGTAPSSVG